MHSSAMEWNTWIVPVRERKDFVACAVLKTIKPLLLQGACLEAQGHQPDTDPPFLSRNLLPVSHLIVNMYLFQES